MVVLNAINKSPAWLIADAVTAPKKKV